MEHTYGANQLVHPISIGLGQTLGITCVGHRHQRSHQCFDLREDLRSLGLFQKKMQRPFLRKEEVFSVLTVWGLFWVGFDQIRAKICQGFLTSRRG